MNLSFVCQFTHVRVSMCTCVSINLFTSCVFFWRCVCTCVFFSGVVLAHVLFFLALCVRMCFFSGVVCAHVVFFLALCVHMCCFCCGSFDRLLYISYSQLLSFSLVDLFLFLLFFLCVSTK